MRLLLDAMCGGLRSYLRICGHDTAYTLDRGIEDDDEILAWAREEERTLVTRDRDLARRAEGICLRSRDVHDQLGELHDAGVSLAVADPPTRCGACNGSLERVAVGVGEQSALPDYVPDDGTDLWQCAECGQFFWKGSHWDEIRERLAEIRS